MATPCGPHLIDLERLSIGHREWDQATAAWHVDTFGALPDNYAAFRQAYQADVTEWREGYALIRDVRSLCAALFSLRHASARGQPHLVAHAPGAVAHTQLHPQPLDAVRLLRAHPGPPSTEQHLGQAVALSTVQTPRLLHQPARLGNHHHNCSPPRASETGLRFRATPGNGRIRPPDDD
ncbi:hypothetical protein P3T39_007489 [Kitasatospora sp. GP82]|nr:hypothetical protein [Kitasatospora sp. GP82]